MTAPVVPPPAPPPAPMVIVPEWRRLDPRMLLVHPVIELVRAIPLLLGLLLAGSTQGHGSRWSLIATGLVVIAATTRWFTTRYRITAAQIQLRRGLIRRRTITAPLDRVRTVDVTAHALHRVLGLAKVAIGTGTSDRKGRDGLELDGLTTAVAEQLREELLHRQPAALTDDAGADRASTASPSAPAEVEIARLDPRWVRYAPFTLSGALTALAIAGFAWRIDSEARLNLSKISTLDRLGRQIRHTPLWVDTIEIVIAVAIFVALASTAGYILAFWRFRLTRHTGGSLHITRGLITTRATSIERRRLHGAELSEPLLLRIAGGARVLAIATGLRVGRGAERGGTILLPPSPQRVSVRVLDAVLATSEPFAASLQLHGPKARRRRYLRALTGAALLVLLAGVLTLITRWHSLAWLATLALIPLAVALAADRYRNLGHTLVAGFLVSRYGSLVRRRCALGTEAIIGWNLRESLFQRRAGLVTLTATTAAGRQGYRLPDVAAADALQAARSCTPGLLEQFLT